MLRTSNQRCIAIENWETLCQTQPNKCSCPYANYRFNATVMICTEGIEKRVDVDAQPEEGNGTVALGAEKFRHQRKNKCRGDSGGINMLVENNLAISVIIIALK